MRRLLLNDTSDYHNGCKAVVKSYQFDHSIKTKEIRLMNKINYSEYDLVILNGEGTMHDSGITPMNFMRALRNARNAGCEIQIHNTVWQNMVHDYDDVLKECSEITVREVLSQREMQKHGVEAKIAPDRSVLIDVPYQEYEYNKVYQGQFLHCYDAPHEYYPRIDVFNQSWEEMVNRLRHSEVLITGRHHEMYAAIKARCRYIAEEGNTWKNRGIAETVGATLPTTVDEALSGEYDEEYKKVFDFCLQTK